MKLCTPYACAHCNDSFSTANDLVSHVQTNHALITTAEPKNHTSEGKFEGEMEEPLENQSKILAREKNRSGSKNYKEIDNKADVALTELEAINDRVRVRLCWKVAHSVKSPTLSTNQPYISIFSPTLTQILK